jgi:protein KRI1
VDALDEDFDPGAHEAAMGAAFGDAYYGEDDDEGAHAAHDGDGKPQFGDLDEELRELLGGEAAGTGGFAAAARRAAARPSGGGDDSGSGSEEEEEEEGDAAAAAGEDGGAAAAEEGEDGRFSKRAMKKWRRYEKCVARAHLRSFHQFARSLVLPPLSLRSALSAKMEEYYALDCEDFVAGLPCRFRYKAVAPDKYGLKTEEVLTLSDKELNQVVSLKKLAPYRDADAKPKCVVAAALIVCGFVVTLRVC